MNKILFAIVTCHANRATRADLQRRTWVPKVVGADVRFFVGQGGNGESRPDEVVLDVADDYGALPAKVRAVCQWAQAHDYDYVLKIDDDVYLHPERMLASPFEAAHYFGRVRGPSGGFPASYCSGFLYWLSRHSLSILASAELNGDSAEDRWVGNTLAASGVRAVHTPHYAVRNYKRGRRIGPSEGPAKGNEIMAIGEVDEAQMEQAHGWCEQDSANYSQISVMIKTFLRDGHLFRTVKEVAEVLPGATMIIVDDGKPTSAKLAMYENLTKQGHKIVWLPFDSGFCAKSNAAVDVLTTDYILIASDDFDFSQFAVVDGIRRMKEVLDKVPSVSVASGRVDNTPYEGYLIRGDGWIREVPLPMTDFRRAGFAEYKLCDITVNYCLVRREVFADKKSVRWADYKIGGDHFEFFDQLKRAGHKVAFVKDVSINQRRHEPQLQHSTYGKYRARAKEALPIFFEKYGLSYYIAFDNRADIRQPDGKVISRILSEEELKPFDLPIQLILPQAMLPVGA